MVAEEIAADAIELTKRVVPYQHGLILRECETTDLQVSNADGQRAYSGGKQKS